MTGRLLLVAIGVATVAMGAAACALDFDRFEPGDSGGLEPVDATSQPRADASSEGGQDDGSMDAMAAAEDAEITDAGADANSPADAAPDGPCTPSSSCIMSAQTCGAECARTQQQCRAMCSSGSCRSNCTRTESTCITQCGDTCSSCTRSAGCSAAADCADAAR